MFKSTPTVPHLSIDYKNTVIKIRWRCIHSSHLKQALGVPFLHSREGGCEVTCHSEVGRRGRNTAWARSQPHYPRGPAVVLQPSPRSVFSDCLNIFAIITFTFTFQTQVSVFYCLSSPLVSWPYSVWPYDWIFPESLGLEEWIAWTGGAGGAGRQPGFVAGWKPKVKSACTLKHHSHITVCMRLSCLYSPLHMSAWVMSNWKKVDLQGRDRSGLYFFLMLYIGLR